MSRFIDVFTKFLWAVATVGIYWIVVYRLSQTFTYLRS